METCTQLPANIAVHSIRVFALIKRSSGNRTILQQNYINSNSRRTMTRFVGRTVRTLVPCSCEPLVSAETPTVEHVNDYPCSTSALTAVRSEARGELGSLPLSVWGQTSPSNYYCKDRLWLQFLREPMSTEWKSNLCHLFRTGHVFPILQACWAGRDHINIKEKVRLFSYLAPSLSG